MAGWCVTQTEVCDIMTFSKLKECLEEAANGYVRSDTVVCAIQDLLVRAGDGTCWIRL